MATANAFTDLYPFRKSTQSFWNSTDSRDPASFGYIYPDIMGTGDRNSIKTRFNANYGWSVDRKTPLDDIKATAEMQPVDVGEAQVFQSSTSMSTNPSLAVKMIEPIMMEMEQPVMRMASSGIHENNGHSNGGRAGREEDREYNNGGSANDPTQVPSFRRGDEILRDEPDQGSRLELQWYIDVEVNKNAMNGTFTIFHFVGPLNQLDEDPACWQTQPILAGLNHILAAPVEACDNCTRQSEEGLKVTGTSAITPILLDYIRAGQLASLSPDDVVPFLKRNMIWRVADVNQQREDPARVEGLEVSVSATISTLCSGSTIPTFKEPLFFPGITADHRSGDPALH